MSSYSLTRPDQEKDRKKKSGYSLTPKTGGYSLTLEEDIEQLTPPAADDELVPATARSTVPATRPVRLARGWPAPVPACSEPAAGAARVAELSVDGVAARHDELVERHVDERHGGHERPAGAG